MKQLAIISQLSAVCWYCYRIINEHLFLFMYIRVHRHRKIEVFWNHWTNKQFLRVKKHSLNLLCVFIHERWLQVPFEVFRNLNDRSDIIPYTWNKYEKNVELSPQPFDKILHFEVCCNSGVLSMLLTCLLPAQGEGLKRFIAQKFNNSKQYIKQTTKFSWLCV